MEARERVSTSGRAGSMYSSYCRLCPSKRAGGRQACPHGGSSGTTWAFPPLHSGRAAPAPLALRTFPAPFCVVVRFLGSEDGTKIRQTWVFAFWGLSQLAALRQVSRGNSEPHLPSVEGGDRGDTGGCIGRSGEASRRGRSVRSTPRCRCGNSVLGRGRGRDSAASGGRGLPAAGRHLVRGFPGGPVGCLAAPCHLPLDAVTCCGS